MQVAGRDFKVEARKLEYDRPLIPSHRNIENQHDTSSIHVPTFWSLLYMYIYVYIYLYIYIHVVLRPISISNFWESGIEGLGCRVVGCQGGRLEPAGKTPSFRGWFEVLNLRLRGPPKYPKEWTIYPAFRVKRPLFWVLWSSW